MFVSGYGIAAGSCEHGNKPVGYTECRELLDQFSECQLINMNFAPWSYSVITSILQDRMV
jgi:hypothetical protein